MSVPLAKQQEYAQLEQLQQQRQAAAAAALKQQQQQQQQQQYAFDGHGGKKRKRNDGNMGSGARDDTGAVRFNCLFF